VGAYKDIEASQEAFETLQENEYIRYEDLPLRAKSGRLIDVKFVSNVYLWAAKKSSNAIKQFHLQFEGQSLAAVTLSLGAAVFPEHGATSTGILRAVDAALYRAKHEGLGRVVVAG
jgi:diguanylate cyclase (GGDEF)-like protein